MVMLEDIRSLSEFQRNTKSHIRRLGKTGRPEVLTVNGKASVVVQDAAAYQRLLDDLEEARTARSIQQMREGKTVPYEEAMAKIRANAAKKRKK